MNNMIIMNRNTSPISPFTDEDYMVSARITEENQYPEKEILRFKENYVKYNPDFLIEQLELANGADEWIQKLMLTFGQEGVLILDPDFFMYEEYAKQMGCPIHYVNAQADFTFKQADILQAIEEKKPKLFILSNPHNPIGTQFSEEELHAYADAMEAVDGYFVIDEAYIEFGQRDYKRPKGDHVIILRTMSKMYGMAGLRIGLMYAAGETYEKATNINHPYPINSLTLNLANQFLENERKVAEFIDYQIASKQALKESFTLVSDVIGVVPSATNFVFTHGDLAPSLREFLESKGYIARYYDENILKNSVRYSILKNEEYLAFQAYIQEWKNSLN